MTNCRILLKISVFALAAVLASCTQKAKISVEIQDAPSSEIVISQQNVNRYDILDTVKTDASGRFTCKVKVEDGDPDFFYLYRNGRKIASLLLQKGDEVYVKADTTGNYEVTGSDESYRLSLVEKEYSDFTSVMDSLVAEISAADGDRTAELNREIAREYTAYYRNRVKYVMENSRSLTVVPVFYQTVGGGLYVFSQDTDAIHFRNIADSLSAVYPDSRYVKALREEADARTRRLELMIRMQNADAVGYLDLELPDTQGRKVRLSDVDAKVVLLCFWSPDDAVQKMFNLDVLKNVYARYNDSGFEIYQVAISADKPAWERIVQAQGLEWVNVCDGLGTGSPAAARYNLSKLPSYFLIVDGEMSDRSVTDGKSLRKALKDIFTF